MKTLCTLLISLLPGLTLADHLLACEVSLNGTRIHESTLNISQSEKATVGDFEGFRIFLQRKSPAHYILEVYDGDQTTRTYAEASLRQPDDFVSNSIWRREALLESQCRLISTK